MSTDIQEAKEKLTIHDLWQMEGLPGEPKKSCCSPFRDEKNPSFSVSADGMLWFDHGTGEGGDAIKFLAKCRGMSNSEACKLFIELSGSKNLKLATQKKRPPSKNTKPNEKPPIQLKPGNEAQITALSKLRRIPMDALMRAQSKGFLRFTNKEDRDERVICWAVTDSTGRNIRLRRLDGELLFGKCKSWAVPNSDNSWPIGAADIGDHPWIALIEGEPDFLAIEHFIKSEAMQDVFAPVCMTGISASIGKDALPYFNGKNVRIFYHADEQGFKGARKWATQLTEADAAHVEFFHLKLPSDQTEAAPTDINEILQNNPSTS